MLKHLRPLIDPMNIAAYLAWVAIGLEVWMSSPKSTGLLPAAVLWPTMVAAHAAVLALFLFGQLGTWTLAMRRGLVWAQMLIALVMIASARYTAVPVLLIIAMAQNAQLYPARPLALLFVAVNAVIYALLRGLWQSSSPVLFLIINASFQLFAMMTSWYAVTAERSRDALLAANADLVATRSLLAESVRDSERLRLSRELHDIAGHKLTALKLNLAALARDPRLADHEPVALCAQLADELLADIRGVVQQMRLHDGMDLRSALVALAAPFPKPQVHLELAPDARVADLAQAEAVLRSVQEALTNAARHGNADHIWIVLRRDEDRIALDIRDDGRGSGALEFGNGLSGMRERLEAIGGRLQVERNAAGGVQLLATLPVIA
ncbi:sensor histidine kinase [Arenimonas oryziterrae]|nr:histidine kinase [Arenimonas oryziterrae]